MDFFLRQLEENGFEVIVDDLGLRFYHQSLGQITFNDLSARQLDELYNYLIQLKELAIKEREEDRVFQNNRED